MKKKSAKTDNKEKKVKKVEIKKINRHNGIAIYVYKEGLFLYSSWVRKR
jgi:hypothetical protein